MLPIVFRLGNFRLTSYVAAIVLSGVITLFYFKRFESQLGLRKKEDFWLLVNVLGFAGFLGARLLYLHSHPPVVESFVAAVISNQTGLSTFGALSGVLLGAAGVSWYLKINFLRLLDYVCLAIPVGHAIARLGCFLNGCCYGRAVDGHFPCAVVFTDPAAVLPPALLGVSLHPVQLYEAAGDLLLAGILYFFVRPRVGLGRFGPGLICAGYAAGYGVLRYASEAFRGNPELMRGSLMPVAQVFSLLTILVAAVFMFCAAKGRHTAAPNKFIPS